MKCLVCKKKLNQGKKFCSYKCYGIAQRKQITKICPICKKRFSVPNCLNRMLYCSRSCYEKGRKKGKYIKCIVCNKKFYAMPSIIKKNRKYCSQKCMGKNHQKNKHFNWKSKQVKCKTCGKKFYAHILDIKKGWGLFCSKNCMNIFYVGENSPNWIDGKSFEPYPSLFNTQLKEKIRVRDNFICQLCSVPELECTKRLLIHHVDYNKENCNEKNLISLCNKCNSIVNYKREYWKAYFTKKLNVFYSYNKKELIYENKQQ